MSRAFVNEDAASGDEELPERPVSEHPNYVTPLGLKLLEEEFSALERRRLELLDAASSAHDQAAAGARDELRYVDRDRVYFQRRLASAILIEPAAQPRDVIAFGATIAARDPAGHTRTYAIVGEDEADPDAGKVSYASPLGKALMGARVGQPVTWRRPAGDLRLSIRRIEYR